MRDLKSPVAHKLIDLIRNSPKPGRRDDTAIRKKQEQHFKAIDGTANVKPLTTKPEKHQTRSKR